MQKTAIVVRIATALGIVLVFLLFGRDSAQAPIIDPKCAAGYELVGEGCIPEKETCELRGDEYHYDETKQECLTQ